MNPWDIEVAFYANHRGIDPDKAHTFTILRWMWNGDLRPLAAAIAEDVKLDQAVLNLLATMIAKGCINATPVTWVDGSPRRRGAGRPKPPANFARQILAAKAYEARKGKGNSDQVFEDIAKALGVSHQVIRQAVTAWHKHSAK